MSDWPSSPSARQSSPRRGGKHLLRYLYHRQLAKQPSQAGSRSSQQRPDSASSKPVGWRIGLTDGYRTQVGSRRSQLSSKGSRGSFLVIIPVSYDVARLCGRLVALPTVSVLICAQNATHSSQMKTHGDIPRLVHPPSMRLRTSCCDLPQNEQDNCSCAVVLDIWQAPSGMAAPSPQTRHCSRTTGVKLGWPALVRNAGNSTSIHRGM